MPYIRGRWLGGRLMENEKKLFKQNFRLLLVIFIMVSAFLIFLSFYVEGYGYELLGIALRQIGVATFIASTVSVCFSEYYSKVREESLRKELATIITQAMEERHSLKEAGIVSIYPDRKGNAIDDLREKLENVEEGTVRMIGATLRVFFNPGSDSSDIIHRIINTKPKVKFQVLLLNVNSLQALYRSEAETVGGSFKDDEDYRKRSGQFIESERSRVQINSLNASVQSREPPIEVRYYDTAPYCLLVMFDDVCYTSQYIYGDSNAQVNTVKLPQIKFKAESNAYKNFKWHFDFVWRNAVPYEEVEKSLKERPVVKTYRQ